MTTAAPVVTIDGPSGSGKGTVGRLLAQRLGWHYLDSGVLYRLVALTALRHQVDFRDAAALAKVAANLDVRFTPAAAGDRIYLEGTDVSTELRTERNDVSAREVASRLLRLQVPADHSRSLFLERSEDSAHVTGGGLEQLCRGLSRIRHPAHRPQGPCRAL